MEVKTIICKITIHTQRRVYGYFTNTELNTKNLKFIITALLAFIHNENIINLLKVILGLPVNPEIHVLALKQLQNTYNINIS